MTGRAGGAAGGGGGGGGGTQRTSTLFNPGLLYTSPTRLPNPPTFWKHDAENATYYAKHPDAKQDLLSAQQLLAEDGGENSVGFLAPRGAYKLLCSDYDFLNDDAARAEARSQGAALPEPPEELKEARYMSRARTCLIKLHQQVRECVEGALAQAAASDAAAAAAAAALPLAGAPGGGGGLRTPAPSPGSVVTLGSSFLSPVNPNAAGMTAFSALSRPALLANTRPALVAPSNVWSGGGAAARPSASGNSALTVASEQASFSRENILLGLVPGGGGGGRPAGGFGAALGHTTTTALAGGALASPDVSFEVVCEGVRAKLALMFDDAMSDLMEQLWAALQHAGGAHAKAARLHNAMVKRDAEVESLAMARAKALEGELQAAQAKLRQAADQAVADATRMHSVALAHNAQVEQLAQAQARLQAAHVEKELAAREVEQAKAAGAAALAREREEHRAELEVLHRRLDDAQRHAAAAQAQLRTRDEELAAAHTRLGEQLSLLEVAFERRDLEVKKAADVQLTVDEFAALVAGQGQQPLDAWVESLEEAAADGALTPGELREGPYGLAKALLLAAKNQGASRAISAMKAALPPELPKHQPPVESDLQQRLRNAPRMARLKEEFVPGLVPDLWVRLLAAPLAEQMAPMVLRRHIAELYAAKEVADTAALAAGLPLPSLHTAIVKHYLSQHGSAAQAERRVVELIQSVRAHATGSPRVNLFSLFLGLQRPGLPAAALNVFLAYRRALRAVPAGAAAPTCVEDEEGAVAWVHPTRWRAVLSGPLSRVLDAATNKAVIKAVAALKTQPARSLPSFGMTDMDELLAVLMDGWAAYMEQVAPEHLMRVFKAHDRLGVGTFELEDFKAMLVAANPTANVSDAKLLDMLLRCMEAVAKEPADPKALKGALTPSAFTQTCVECGVVGSLAAPASAADLHNLATAVQLASDVQAGLKQDMACVAFQSKAADQLQSELQALQDRVRLAKGGEGPAPSALAAAAPAVPVELDADLLASYWAQLSGAGQRLVELQAEVSRVAADARKNAAAIAAAKEQLLKDQLEEAKGQLREATQERQAAQALAAKAQEAAEAAERALSEAQQQLGSPRPATLSRAGSRANKGGLGSPMRQGSRRFVDEDGNEAGSVSFKASASRRATDEGGASHDGAFDYPDGDGGSPTAASRLRADLSRAQRRAEDAEARYASIRAKLAEQQAALDKLSDKALKRRAAEEKAAVQKLLSGLAKLLAGMQLPHATGQGAPEPPAAAYMERLAHLAGLMHGMSAQLDVLSAKQQHHAATVLASLPPATPSKPSAHAHGSHRAPHARPTSPLQPLDEHAGDGDDDGHAQQQHSNDGGSGDGTLMWPSLPSPLLQQMRTGTAFAHAASPDPTAGPAADAPTAQHDEDATPRVEFATDAGGGGGGKPLTRGSKSVALPRQHAKQAALGNLALSAHPGALALPDADDEAGAEAPPGAAAAAGHADKAPRVHPSDVSRVVDRAAKESKDQQRRTFLLGASQGAREFQPDGAGASVAGAAGAASALPSRAASPLGSSPGPRHRLSLPGGGAGAPARTSASGLTEDQAAAAASASVLATSLAAYHQWLAVAAGAVLEVAHLAAALHTQSEQWMAGKQQEVAELQEQLAAAAEEASAMREALDRAEAAGMPEPQRPSLMGGVTSLLPRLSVLSNDGTLQQQQSRRASYALERASLSGAANAGAAVEGALQAGAGGYGSARQSLAGAQPPRHQSEGGELGLSSVPEDGAVLASGGAPTVASLLLEGFALSDEDAMALARGVMVAVHASGGFPLVLEDGSLVHAQTGEVVVSTDQAARLPDLATQARHLRHLYVSCAGLLVAQHVHRARINALDAMLRQLLARARALPPASPLDDPAAATAAAGPQDAGRGTPSPSSSPPEAARRQLELVSAALSAMRRHAHACEGLLLRRGPTEPPPSSVPAPNPTSDAVAAGSADAISQAGEGALQALQEELSHADLLVHEARSMMGGKPAAAGRAAAGAASQAPAERGGSASRPRADAANAPEMPPGLSPFEQLVFRLTHQVVGPEVEDEHVLAVLLDLHPSQLFRGMLGDAVHADPDPGLRPGSGASQGRHHHHTPQQPQQQEQEQAADAGARAAVPAAPILHEFSEQPAPPGSPANEQDEPPSGADALGADSDLPPGPPLVLLGPALLQRSGRGPPRYLSPLHHHPKTAVMQGGGPPVEVVIPSGRYERRPHTARRFVESVLSEGLASQPPPQRVWMTRSGAFWAQRPMEAADLVLQQQMLQHQAQQQHGGVRANAASAAAAAALPAGRPISAHSVITGPWPWWHPALRGGQAAWERHLAHNQQQQAEPAGGDRSRSPSPPRHAHLAPLLGSGGGRSAGGSGRSPSASPPRLPLPAALQGVPAASAQHGDASAAAAPPIMLPAQRERRPVVSARTMHDVVAQGQEAAVAHRAARLRQLAASPELGGWGAEPPAHLSTAALASGAMANGGPQVGFPRAGSGSGPSLASGSLASPRHRLLGTAVPQAPPIFSGVRVDSAGRLVSAGAGGRGANGGGGAGARNK